MKQNVFGFLVACIVPLVLHAQSAHLVKDINSTTNSSAESSSPEEFVRFGSRIFFAADTLSAGRELWATDGTQAGTTQVADLRVGSASSNPSHLMVVNGKLIFNARDSRGEELWMSDGTAAGTRVLADISSGSSTPGDRIVFHGQMLFSAHEPVNGRELWITDGTPAGTKLFKDLVPGGQDSEPRSFVVLNDAVYFVAGNALWKSDGTPAGTVVVKAEVFSYQLTVAGSRIFFGGSTAATGTEPWVSDGTEAGTHIIADLAAGATNSLYHPLVAFGNRALFTAVTPEYGSELWISDGTAAGTRMVRDLNPGPESATDYSSIAVLGETAFFSAGTPFKGMELWKTDGTEAGTILVQGGSAGSALERLATAGSRIFYFTRSSGGRALWMTDGTQQVRLPDSGLRTISSVLTNIDGDIYFSGANSLNGFEPWKSDGTRASMIANIATDPAPSSRPGNLTAAGDWVYFDAWNGMLTGADARSIWRSDGTPEGTVELTELQPYLSEATVVGRSVFFSQSNTLWISDGTPAGTKLATEFVSRFPSIPSIRHVLGGTIFVSAGEQLWATNLTPGARAVPLGVRPGFGFIELAGRLFYLAQDSSRFSLTSSDGTAAGTYTVVGNFEGYAFGQKTAVMGGQLYFTNFGEDTKLWKSDGTSDGTVAVTTLAGGAVNLVAAGRNLFFVNGAHQLWVSDGTEAGTHALPATPANDIIAVVGDRVVFAASDAAAGQELWISDGTSEGTRLLRDIVPGVSGSSPGELTSIAGLVYFSAYDGLHGWEVWMTDGTAEGTKLAADVEPGPVYSYPTHYVRAGERVFFTATTAATGNELWALPLPATPRLTIGDVRVAEGSSGAVARFTVTLSSPSAQTVTVEYATSDGTATGGSDYDAASGTLTFAAGETSKRIDVQVRGDAAVERNESFFVTLRAAAGAVLEDAFAFAVIDDDDVTADIALTPDFSSLDNGSVFVNITNHGPGTATNLRGFATATPATVAASTCASCPQFSFQLASGESKRSFEYRWFGQQYVTFTATAKERDPVPSNNSIGWSSNTFMAMDALYLTPGVQANVWFGGFSSGSFSVESSNPSVVSVPGSVTVPAPAKPTSFIARGIAPGTATIRVFTPSGNLGTLEVQVVAAGTKPRWPGALNIFPNGNQTRFDEPATFTIYRPATAPFTGQTATGLVTIKANGRVTGHVTLTSDPTSRFALSVPYYVADAGNNQITVEYAGDENFLPQTDTWNIEATRGLVTITGSAQRDGTAGRIRILVTGSPMAAPTGTITVAEAGVIPATQATLTATSTPGVAQADITLTNVPSGSHTLVITYDGDTHYLQSTQNMRTADERRRSVRH